MIFEKDISEVSRGMGKMVGVALVEMALGKGISAGLKALRGITGSNSVSAKSQCVETFLCDALAVKPFLISITGNLGYYDKKKQCVKTYQIDFHPHFRWRILEFAGSGAKEKAGAKK